VRKIAVSGSTVYVGGSSFTLPTGRVTTGVAQWDGRNWTSVGSGLGNGAYAGPIMAIAVRGNNLYIGGDSFVLPGAPVPPLLSSR
jgi:trimeric autotransporter adhesin